MSPGPAPQTVVGPAMAVSAMFAAAGTSHLLRPATYDAIVPPALPGPARWWTIGSGVAELGLAALVASRRTRAAGGLLSAAFLIAVLPANVRTVRVVAGRSAAVRAIAWVRLPLQAPLVALALRAATDPR